MTSTSPLAADSPEPAWEIAKLFPPQGDWSDTSYLSFTESLSQLVEIVDGRVEVLEMPTKSHQKIVQFLLNLILNFLSEHQLGDAISAPYRIRLRDRTFREPDLVVYLKENLECFGERFGQGADLVMEIVSGDTASRNRDYQDKRRDYAEARVMEYWIVDPDQARITVLVLDDTEYVELGVFTGSDMAGSKLLPGFRVSVESVFRAGQQADNR